MDSVIKAVLEDLESRGEPTTAEAIAERMFVLSVLNVDEVTPEHDAYIERMLPAVRDYLDRQRPASRCAVISTAPTCQKCARRSIITFRVEPEEAFAAVTLNRWRTNICPSCFDQEAERAGIRYTLVGLDGVSWSDKPSPRNPYKRRR